MAYDDLERQSDAQDLLPDSITGYVLPTQDGATVGALDAWHGTQSLLERSAPGWRGDGLANIARQNAAEADFTYGQPFNFGTMEAPPMARAAAHKGVDLIAHWFNLFGTQHLNVPGEAHGSYDILDWSWNHTNVGGYDPQRHPTLGWYAGDDPNVLDWICYWLIEAGINAVSLVPQDVTAGFSMGSWTSPTDGDYWIYRLLAQTPSARGLRYLLWGGSAGTTTAIEAGHDDIITATGTYPGAYTYTENGASYLVVPMWDMEAIRGVYDSFSGQANTVAMLKGLAAKAQATGRYNGVMVLARNGGVVTATPDTSLLSAGCIVLDASYEARYGTDADYGNDYTTYADTAELPAGFNEVPNVSTSAYSVAGHPSAWTLADSTPEAFGRLLARAVQSVIDHGQRRMLTIYNVSEWIEGGPGLVPNVEDGWGYLDAVKRCPPAAPSHRPFVTEWTEVTSFGDTWANFGSGIEHLRYRRVGDTVQIRGLVAGGASGSTVFTLPFGYRPPFDLAPSMNLSYGGIAQVDVGADGHVGVTQISGATGTYTAIDVQFSTS